MLLMECIDAITEIGRKLHYSVEFELRFIKEVHHLNAYSRYKPEIGLDMKSVFLIEKRHFKSAVSR